MVCSDNDTLINITIPVVIFPKSAGEKLINSLNNNEKGRIIIMRKEILEIDAKGALEFIVAASAFLLLFYFMSAWFIWLLIILFCIGGTEICKECGQKTVIVPISGEVLLLSVTLAFFLLLLLLFGRYVSIIPLLGLANTFLVSV